LNFVAARLRYASNDPHHPRGYRTVADFEHDLSLVRQSLCAHHGHRLVQLLVDPLLRKVRTFGFRLHTLDIRQHSRIHAQALAELAAAATAVPSGAGDGAGIAAESAELLEVLRGVAKLKKTYPADRSARTSSAIRVRRMMCGIDPLATMCGIDVKGSEGDPGLMPFRCLNRSNRCAGGEDDAQVVVGGSVSADAEFVGTLAGSDAGLLRFE